VRSLLGLVLMAGGLVGFLPILGFWMFPLGVALVIADFPPLRRRLERWLNDTRRRYHIDLLNNGPRGTPSRTSGPQQLN
jgi:hypothetical protein